MKINLDINVQGGKKRKAQQQEQDIVWPTMLPDDEGAPSKFNITFYDAGTKRKDLTGCELVSVDGTWYVKVPGIDLTQWFSYGHVYFEYTETVDGQEVTREKMFWCSTEGRYDTASAGIVYQDNYNEAENYTLLFKKPVDEIPETWTGKISIWTDVPEWASAEPGVIIDQTFDAGAHLQYMNRAYQVHTEFYMSPSSTVPEGTISSEYSSSNEKRWERMPLWGQYYSPIYYWGEVSLRDEDEDRFVWDINQDRNHFMNLWVRLKRDQDSDPKFEANPDMILDGEPKPTLKQYNKEDKYGFKKNYKTGKLHLEVREIGEESVCHQMYLTSSPGGVYSIYNYGHDKIEQKIRVDGEEVWRPASMFYHSFDTSDTTNFKITTTPSYSAGGVEAKIINMRKRYEIYLAPKRYAFRARSRYVEPGELRQKSFLFTETCVCDFGASRDESCAGGGDDWSCHCDNGGCASALWSLCAAETPLPEPFDEAGISKTLVSQSGGGCRCWDAGWIWPEWWCQDGYYDFGTGEYVSTGEAYRPDPAPENACETCPTTSSTWQIDWQARAVDFYYKSALWYDRMPVHSVRTNNLTGPRSNYLFESVNYSGRNRAEAQEDEPEALCGYTLIDNMHTVDNIATWFAGHNNQYGVWQNLVPFGVWLCAPLQAVGRKIFGEDAAGTNASWFWINHGVPSFGEYGENNKWSRWDNHPYGWAISPSQEGELVAIIRERPGDKVYYVWRKAAEEYQANYTTENVGDPQYGGWVEYDGHKVGFEARHEPPVIEQQFKAISTAMQLLDFCDLEQFVFEQEYGDGDTEETLRLKDEAGREITHTTKTNPHCSEEWGQPYQNQNDVLYDWSGNIFGYGINADAAEVDLPAPIYILGSKEWAIYDTNKNSELPENRRFCRVTADSVYWTARHRNREQYYSGVSI